MKSDDIIYLLISYLIIADRDININELIEIDKELNPSAEVKEIQNKIFSESEESISYKQLIDEAINLANDNRFDIDKLFDIMAKIIYSDGYYDSYEKKFYTELAIDLSYDNNLDEYLQKHKRAVNINSEEILWTDSLKDSFYLLLSLLNNNNVESIDLFSDISFSRKVKSIGHRARQDLMYTERQMNKYNKNLRQLSKEYTESFIKLKSNQRKDQNSENLIKLADRISNEIINTVEVSLKQNIGVLNKKRRNVNFFTIAFMGRTKAGKSTLHKIITKTDDDNIGAGKIRTTRFNRSWYWENLRIIDTPGIGAPGGKTDTETARSVIDEADLICYVVTNDSIQEDEFNFLHILEDQNKPFLVLLNIKENLTISARLKRFLRDPLNWKTDKGVKNIQGHIDRIKENIAKNYDPNFVKIIPTMLLAAQLEQVNLDITEEERKALLTGSNIEAYIKEVKKIVYSAGNLRKSQNIVDGTIYQIKTIREKFEEYDKEFSETYDLIEKSLETIKTEAERELEKTITHIRKTIDTTYNTLTNNAFSFSQNYYESKNIDKEWSQYQENKTVYSKMEKEIESLLSHFVEELTSIVNESVQDLEFLINNTRLNFESVGGKVYNYRFYKDAAISVATVLVTIVTIASLGLTGPIAFAVGAGISIIGYVVKKASNLFVKSKEDRIKEKQQKLYGQLEKILIEERKSLKTKQIESIRENINKVMSEINKTFSSLLIGSDEILSIISKIIKESTEVEEILNKHFAIRILQQLGEINSKDSETEIGGLADNLMLNITRTYAPSKFLIQSNRVVESFKQEKINKILKSNIKFEYHE